MMNKIIFFLLLLITNFSFSQKINTEGNGYTEIVKADSLTKTEIYNKLKEWISLNYKSANDVIQLDTKDKLIVKGNFVLEYVQSNTLLNMRVTNVLLLSIKDNRYKIDLTPTEIYNPDYPSVKAGEDKIKIYITEQFMNKEVFTKYANELSKQTYIDMGYTEKKIKKMLLSDYDLDESYIGAMDFYNNFKKEINNIYTSIKNGVAKNDDW
jgi:Domain of unknown function (DUF4468) with TBP-like fold